MRRRRDSSSFISLFILLAMVAGAVYVYFSADFERNAPTISMKTNGFWNLKKPLNLHISDDTGLVSYKVVMRTSEGDKELAYEKLMVPQNKLTIALEPPHELYRMKGKKVQIVVQAQDMSKWNFFKGNVAVKRFNLTIDKRRPRVHIVNNSYKISRGGSALVIFRATDENLVDVSVAGNHGKMFKAQPFYKEGFYIALIAWPVQDSGFKATVVAKDAAGNITRTYVPLYLKNKVYRVSNITLSDRFLDGKIYDLAEEFEETQGVEDKLKQFRIINEDVRAHNEELIHELTSVVSDEMISDFKIHRMYPLKNAKVVAHFGDHRKYYYKGEFISEAYHMGLDLASYAMAPIKTQNSGKVVFADYNGLYGNMPVISHGLGLYTLYGHCSSIDVSKDEEVAPGQKIANTGKTGYAMGDHLHFGVLVQGIEVRPQEWMDAQWIKLNITDIIAQAKKMIDKR